MDRQELLSRYGICFEKVSTSLSWCLPVVFIICWNLNAHTLLTIWTNIIIITHCANFKLLLGRLITVIHKIQKLVISQRTVAPCISRKVNFSLYIKACDEGKYGEECKHDCSCGNNATCDHVTGICNCSSVEGKTGTLCDEG